MSSSQDLAGAETVQDFVAMYRGHERRIFRYCVGRLRNSTDAEDAAQETFIRAARQLDRVVGDPGPYLRGIAHHVCVDVQRARRVEQVPLEDVDRPDPARGPETVVTDRSVIERMWRALTRNERVLLAHAFAGFNYEEIGRLTGMSPTYVSVGIARARKRLRQLAEAVGSVILVPAVLRRILTRLARRANAKTPDAANMAFAIVQQTGLLIVSALVGITAMAGPRGTLAGPASPRLVAVGAGSFSGVSAAPVGVTPLRAPISTPPPPGRRSATVSPPSSGGGVLRTVATALPGGNAGPDDGIYQSITASPDYAQDHTIFASQWTANNCTQCGTLLRSSDGGSTWTHVSEVGFAGGQILLPTDYLQEATIFDASPEGLLRSDDGGHTFSPVATLPLASAAVVPGSPAGDAQVLLVAVSNPAGATAIYDSRSGQLSAGPVLPAGFVADTVAYAGSALIAAGQTAGDETTDSASELVRCAPACAVVATLPGERPPLQITVSPDVAADGLIVVTAATHLYVSGDAGVSYAGIGAPAGNTLATGAILPSPSGTPTVLVSGYSREPSGAAQAVLVSWARGATGLTAVATNLAGVTSLAPMTELPGGDLLGAVVTSDPNDLYGLRCSADGGSAWAASC